MSTLFHRHMKSQTAQSDLPILMIHGLFGSLENLAGVAKQLSSEREVFLVDLPNHARSAHTDETSHTAMADAVAAWMHEHDVECVDIIGHSLGGKVAMQLALTMPSLVRHLVVIDIAPAHYPPHHSEVFEGLNSLDLELVSNRREADAHMIQFVPDVDVRSFLLKNLVKNTGESPETKDNAFMWRFNLPVLSRDYPLLIQANTQAVFDGRVLFIKGGHSDYIIESYRHDIVSRFPNATVKVVNDTGHWLHAEKPVITAGIIARYINR